jgi:hypothetical protein
MRKVRERLCHRRDLRREENVSRKRLLVSQRLRESLNPTVEGIPTKRLETTTSCSLNRTIKGIPTRKGLKQKQVVA